MTREEILALARLAPNAILHIEIQVRAEDFAQALHAQDPGPRVLSTRQAANTFGWADKDWRRWAPTIPGAVKVGKNWRLPSAACREWADRLMKRKSRTDEGSTPPRSALNRPRRGGNYGRYRSQALPPDARHAANYDVAPDSPNRSGNRPAVTAERGVRSDC